MASVYHQAARKTLSNFLEQFRNDADKASIVLTKKIKNSSEEGQVH